MDIAIVGLGKMGGNIARRLMRAGHRVVGYDRDEEVRQTLSDDGAEVVETMLDVVPKLEPPRAVWFMLPAGRVTGDAMIGVAEELDQGDIVIDGGNSRYRETVMRSKILEEMGVRMVDVGTSGGIWGLEEGYSMMIGGETEAVDHLRPIFEVLAPGTSVGWGHVGPPGSGHFVKMVHNGIEYGMMQAYAEGFAIMKEKKEFDLDLHQVSRIWQTGSVVRSWLLDLTADIIGQDADLAGIAPYVQDSGEGRWTVQEAIDLDVPAPVITLALIQRLNSRNTDSYADKLLAAMRQAFGGHAIKQE